MRILFVAWACLVFGVAFAHAQTKAVSPPYEIVKQDVDLEVTATGQYLQSQELIVRPLTSQGVEATRQFRFSDTNGYQDRQITHAYVPVD